MIVELAIDDPAQHFKCVHHVALTGTVRANQQGQRPE